ncbi:unnamed protein product, partial [Meganyctiphanes norvegica]
DPLHWAATTNNVEEIKNIIGDGADIDQKTGSGYTGNTALHIGGRYGRTEVVRLLLKNGADATITNDAGESPMDRAHIQFCRQSPRNMWCALATSDYRTTLPLLLDGCEKSGCVTGLQCEVRQCRKVTATTTSTKGHLRAAAASCGPQVWFWWSAQRCRNYPFHWAAVVGDETEVSRFLGKGRDVNLRDGDRYTPLMLAAWAGRAETVSLLLDHGGDTELTNVRGRTALILANKRFCSNPNSKGCNLGGVDYNETILLLEQGISSPETATAVTRTFAPCVRFQYWGTWYEASSCLCCWNNKNWCATSTSPQGSITAWDYCDISE